MAGAERFPPSFFILGCLSWGEGDMRSEVLSEETLGLGTFHARYQASGPVPSPARALRQALTRRAIPAPQLPRINDLE